MMDDNIQNKLDIVGLYLPKQLQIRSNLKTPPTWIRIRGDKECILGHDPQNHGLYCRTFWKGVETNGHYKDKQKIDNTTENMKDQETDVGNEIYIEFHLFSILISINEGRYTL